MEIYDRNGFVSLWIYKNGNGTGVDDLKTQKKKKSNAGLNVRKCEEFVIQLIMYLRCHGNEILLLAAKY